MNGQNKYNCSHDDESKTWVESNNALCTGGQLFRTKVPGQKRTRLRLINHSSFMSLWFSIDNHTLSIVEMDGIEVEPISARGVYVNVGQRYSVIVHTDQTPGNYYMRATLPQTCFLPYTTYTNPALESGGYQVRGVISYPDVDINAEPIGVEGNVTNPYGVGNNLLRGDIWEGCLDMPFDMPTPVRKERALDVAAANQHSIQFEFEQAGEINRIFVNRVRNSSTIYLPALGSVGMGYGQLTRGNRPLGFLSTRRRNSGRPWTRILSRVKLVATVTGSTKSTSKSYSSLRRTKACRW
jgi:FtsP/CotA-like multicopper oxidase with cupredoxin domain